MESISRFADAAVAFLRIVAGLSFMQHGVQKLFGWLGGFGGEPGGTAEIASLMGVAGILETFGGLLIVLGLFTRPVALVLAAEMLVAYVLAHLPNSVFPLENGGEPAVLYFAIFLALAVIGPGALSIDRARRPGPEIPVPAGAR